MEQANGAFIVIEGTDGSGKATQFSLLRTRLEQAGYDVETFDFPRYDQPSSHFVREYLNGHYGTGIEVSPYTASLFYALDRFEAAQQIREALAAGKIVLSNRFTASSMAHQGGKFTHAEERRGYFVWLDNLEFLLLKIPRPNMNFVLRVPAEIAQTMVDQKNQKDIHETELDHLQRSVQTYDDLCSLFPQDFQRIDCARGQQLLSVDDIQKIVWEKVSAVLPKPPSKPRARKLSTELFNTKTQPVKQLETAESISLLVQLTLARTQTIVSDKTYDYSQKDATGNYQYFVPTQLSDELTEQYTLAMNSIFELYSELQFRLHDYLAKSSDTPKKRQDTAWRQRLVDETRRTIHSVLPLAARSPISLAKSLSEETLPELVQRELSGKPPKPLLPNMVARLAKTTLNETYSEANDSVTLTHVWPRNELDLVPDILYPFSGMALRDIQSAVSTWNYDQKSATLIAYAADPDRDTGALALCQYQFDIVSDIRTLQEATEAACGTATWQALTPRYGFEMPELIESAGLSELYERCFDISLELHSALQAAGHETGASYTVLLGHKTRWQLHASGQTLVQNLPDALRSQLREKVLTRHPLLVSEYRNSRSSA